ncbi:MAG: hypothetical protein R6U41_00915 [Desulfosalsimonas sp.]|uniref:hypothetical protein n=1 Tax=Desulfosalsimonas sp. TaxID=3073848 RepID=UPI003970AFB6
MASSCRVAVTTTSSSVAADPPSLSLAKTNPGMHNNTEMQIKNRLHFFIIFLHR